MYLVIMAGGSGTRFWPASRKNTPKQFLNIIGPDPMIVETCNRMMPLAQDAEMVVILGRDHLDEAARLLAGREIVLLGEPIGRNTAPCIGLGAIYARHLGYEGPMGFLPADHFIGDVSAFLGCIKKAGETAESGCIAALGIVPTKPETGYGYIRRSEAIGSGEKGVYRVSAFVEKPDLETALEYLRSGDYLWNAGVFVATPETVLKEIRQYLPALYDALKGIEGALGTDAFEAELEKAYDAMETVSFDHGILERTTSPIAVIPCDCGWSDVGSWTSLYELRKADRDKDGNLGEGTSILIDSRSSFVSSRSGRLVACLGLENCLVVDTPDALLVADLRRSQEIRQIVERLRRDQKEEFL